MTLGNGVLSNLFAHGSTAPKSVREPAGKESLSATVDTEELAPEAFVTLPTFAHVEGVLTGIVQITPKIAQAWLARNKNIRKLQESRIGLFKESMARNKWDLNGESIKFDKSGNLVDGQNRLTACVLAECNFTSSVVYGIESALNVDRGKSRKPGQIIQALGGAYDANKTAAMINLLHAYNDENSKGFATVGHGRHPITMDDIVDFAMANQQDLNHSLRVTYRTKNLFNKTSLHATLHYIFGQTAGIALADKFYTSLIDGIGLEEDDPIYLLREQLLKQRSSGLQPNTNPYAGLVIKGWNLFVTGKRLRRLSYKFDVDGVPKILGRPVSA